MAIAFPIEQLDDSSRLDGGELLADMRRELTRVRASDSSLRARKQAESITHLAAVFRFLQGSLPAYHSTTKTHVVVPKIYHAATDQKSKSWEGKPEVSAWWFKKVRIGITAVDGVFVSDLSYRDETPLHLPAGSEITASLLFPPSLVNMGSLLLSEVEPVAGADIEYSSRGSKHALLKAWHLIEVKQQRSGTEAMPTALIMDNVFGSALPHYADSNVIGFPGADLVPNITLEHVRAA